MFILESLPNIIKQLVYFLSSLSRGFKEASPSDLRERYAVRGEKKEIYTVRGDKRDREKWIFFLSEINLLEMVGIWS